MANTLNILIGGEAGQGLVTVGTLLTKALGQRGYAFVVTQGYQSRIRGGHNCFEIRVSDQEVYAPQETIDLLIALDAKTIDLHQPNLSQSALIQDLSSSKTKNITALGVIAALLNLDHNLIQQIVSETFQKKGATIVEQNLNALQAATDLVNSQAQKLKQVPQPCYKEKRKVMNGNEAIALGAISAGLKCAFFYPMTPATSINLSLVAQAKQHNLIVEQVEDEIAAINMAIGASFAGAPSMVATSGGGFALMTEAISLAGMTETPLVVVVAQRPGPATGLPTRTEQADLEFVLYSGHGEFPRSIFSPGSVEECFYTTRQAFEVAWKTQGPVFILTDQFLADSYRSVAPFDLEKFSSLTGTSETTIEEPYLRHKITSTGLSPRLIPGQTKHLVVTDSDEHTEDGHLTEDLGVRKAMVEKRLRKLNLHLEKCIAPTFWGDKSPELLFVCWGSTKGSVQEAITQLQNQSQKAALLHFSQVWPLKSADFIDHLKNAKTVIGVEGNATGQFAKLLRQETGFEIKKLILRYDGLPITPEYILRHVNGNS
ncbi:MAG: 2-oxoacid:acceptor oxidoreductase subunit alpha [Pseudomonadota bacterium]